MGDNNIQDKMEYSIQDKLGYLWVITTIKINWGTYG